MHKLESNVIKPISSIHQKFLLQALDLAKLRRGFCAPNPAVGAVIVKHDEVIATGYHTTAGMAHAEVDALSKLSPAQAQGATLYVTLEPCCHWGKTPPCIDKIQAMGIAKVIYAYHDPNPQVAGQGAVLLNQSGISCEQVELTEIKQFYQSYHYWRATGLPYVTAKIAMSLDGKIAGSQGKPIAITGSEMRRYTHQQRLQTDAILTTAKTILADNPQLNARLDNTITAKPVYILDRQLQLTGLEKVFKTASKLTLLHNSQAKSEYKAYLQAENVQLVPIAENEAQLDLKQVLQYIGREGKHDLWVEAGGQCLQSLLQQNLVQQILIYIAPKILGRNATSAFTEPLEMIANSQEVHWQSFGRDVCCSIHLNRKGSG